MNRISRPALLAFTLTLLASSAALAAEGELNAGDTAWVLASAALVLLMLPGLALFYAGMVRGGGGQEVEGEGEQGGARDTVHGSLPKRYAMPATKQARCQLGRC